MCLPFGPTTSSTSTSSNSCSTPSPTPTLSASRPSFAAPTSSPSTSSTVAGSPSMPSSLAATDAADTVLMRLVLLSSMDDFALATVPTGPDEAGGPPPSSSTDYGTTSPNRPDERTGSGSAPRVPSGRAAEQGDRHHLRLPIRHAARKRSGRPQPNAQALPQAPMEQAFAERRALRARRHHARRVPAHVSGLGEFFLASDAVVPSFTRDVRLVDIANQIPREELDESNRIGYTIGGMMLFPGNRVDRKMTINGARGLPPKNQRPRPDGGVRPPALPRRAESAQRHPRALRRLLRAVRRLPGLRRLLPPQGHGHRRLLRSEILHAVRGLHRGSAARERRRIRGVHAASSRVHRSAQSADRRTQRGGPAGGLSRSVNQRPDRAGASGAAPRSRPGWQR